MTHQIPPHLAFCTPGQNQKAEQGTNPETLKRDKQTDMNPHGTRADLGSSRIKP